MESEDERIKKLLTNYFNKNNKGKQYKILEEEISSIKKNKIINYCTKILSKLEKSPFNRYATKEESSLKIYQYLFGVLKNKINLDEKIFFEIINTLYNFFKSEKINPFNTLVQTLKEENIFLLKNFPKLMNDIIIPLISKKDEAKKKDAYYLDQIIKDGIGSIFLNDNEEFQAKLKQCNVDLNESFDSIYQSLIDILYKEDILPQTKTLVISWFYFLESLPGQDLRENYEEIIRNILKIINSSNKEVSNMGEIYIKKIIDVIMYSYEEEIFNLDFIKAIFKPIIDIKNIYNDNEQYKSVLYQILEKFFEKFGRILNDAKHVDIITGHVDTFTKHVYILTKHAYTLAKRIEPFTKNIDTLKKDVDTLRNAVDTLKEDVDILSKNIESLTKNIDALKRSIDTLKKEVNRLTENIDTLKKDVNTLPKIIDTLKKNIDILTKDVNTLPENIDTLKNNIDELPIKIPFFLFPDILKFILLTIIKMNENKLFLEVEEVANENQILKLNGIFSDLIRKVKEEYFYGYVFNDAINDKLLKNLDEKSTNIVFDWMEQLYKAKLFLNEFFLMNLINHMENLRDFHIKRIIGVMRMIKENSENYDEEIIIEIILKKFNEGNFAEEFGFYIFNELSDENNLTIDIISIYQIITKKLKDNKSEDFIINIVDLLTKYLIREERAKKVINALNVDKIFFKKLYKIFCYNPFDTLVLILISKEFELAYYFVQNLSKIDLDSDDLIQLSKAVQIFESKFFIDVRIKLLNPKSNIYLIKTLYAILLLLPPGPALKNLSFRLKCLEILYDFDDEEKEVIKDDNYSISDLNNNDDSSSISEFGEKDSSEMENENKKNNEEKDIFDDNASQISNQNLIKKYIEIFNSKQKTKKIRKKDFKLNE